MIKAIFFDLDGVLVDAKEWHYKALNNALKDICNYEIPFDMHIKEYDGLPTKVKLKKLVDEKSILIQDYEKIFILKQYYTLQIIATYCKPDPVKIDMMYQFSSYKKACITNSIYKTAYEMLVRSGLNYYLDYVQGNEATSFPKPSPAPYLKAMSVIGILPKEVVIIEDSEKGIQSAKDSGAYVFEVSCYDQVNYKSINNFIKEIT